MMKFWNKMSVGLRPTHYTWVTKEVKETNILKDKAERRCGVGLL